MVFLEPLIAIAWENRFERATAPGADEWNRYTSSRASPPEAAAAVWARSLLATLGKTLDLEPSREPLRRLLDVHLHAEQIRQLIVLRARTLTYPALHRLADHANAAGAQLWLVVHRERPPGPVAQLLQALPHETASCRRCPSTRPSSPRQTARRIRRWARAWSSRTSAPSTTSSTPRRGAACGARSRAASRVATTPPFHYAWDQAHDWTTRCLDDHAEWTYQVARVGDTAVVARAAALAARIPDPQSPRWPGRTSPCSPAARTTSA